MTTEPRYLDAIAEGIVGPHAAAQARQAEDLARRRTARTRTVKVAAGIIAVALAANVLGRYLHDGTIHWSSVVTIVAAVAAITAGWRQS